MLQQFKTYVKTQALFSKSERILLAVSGGMDSICMSHLFAEAGFSFAIAHCNFKLRGVESDEDAAFVEALANELGVDFYKEDFETEDFAKAQKVSIQMAARDLRYEWLEGIRQKHQFSYIATAHHLNDSIETVLYNFAKGCGIRGLHGILPKKDKIIRPLLFAERSQIEAFIQAKQMTYREDASNASDKYSRNFIRHQIVPKLKELNPSFEKTTASTLQNIRESEFLFMQAIEQYKDLLFEQKGKEYFIDFHKLPAEAAHTVLYELLKPMGFHGDQIKMLLEQEHQSGISFSTKTHTLLVDRNRYIVRKNEILHFVEKDIQESEASIMIDERMLVFETLESIPDPIPKLASIALLDYEKLSFPLQLRPWKAGDIFQPFGMQGKHQKVQDFLTHKKLNRFEKEKVYVLESSGKICWVVGMRLDERFRMSDTTQKVFCVRDQKKIY